MTLHNISMLRPNLVLIVEDEPLFALDVELTLEEAGFSCEIHTSNAEALRWLEHNIPAAAILDIGLKDGPSEQVARLLANQNIPFIVCSGSAPEYAASVFAHATWLPKPFEPSRLLATLADVMSHLEFQDELAQRA
ncbi:response regulator [Rhizobium sp. LjRoot98]|uniref:response regulator n=1 Tax=Rhizobium sp. LjRoot98 TaxID=3342345 RepID=UPI003ED06BA0